jgi:hypothetical protein
VIVINKGFLPMLPAPSPELHTLHLHSGILAFRSCSQPLMLAYNPSKIILKDVKLVVTCDAVESLKPDSMLITACGKDTEICLQNCTFEAAADSPRLIRLRALTVGCGAQVTFLNTCRTQPACVAPTQNLTCRNSNTTLTSHSHSLSMSCCLLWGLLLCR